MISNGNYLVFDLLIIQKLGFFETKHTNSKKSAIYDENKLA